MEAFSALLPLCAGNSPVTGVFPSERPVTRSFDVSFDLRLNKRPSKQSWGWCTGNCADLISVWLLMPWWFAVPDVVSGMVINCYDYVMKWKRFPRYWPFVRGIHRWFPLIKAQVNSFEVFCDVILSKPLNKQTNGQWFETPWSSCNVTVMQGEANYRSAVVIHRFSQIGEKSTEASPNHPIGFRPCGFDYVDPTLSIAVSSH